MEILAPAKINLSLAIKGKRPDGYHELETVMQKISLADRLTLEKVNSGVSLRCHQGSTEVPDDEKNLAHRAASVFFSEAACEGGVAITLEKNIPVAAGLGGGSSDAGAVLSGLNELYPGLVPFGRLLEIAKGLGADVPFFVNRSPSVFATGIGDILHGMPSMGECYIVLVNPGFPVSTKWVYDNFALTSEDNTYTLGPGFRPSNKSSWLSEMIASLKEHSVSFFINDLERVTQKKYPEIGNCKQKLIEDGADLALMSGSGPTVFGVFSNPVKARSSRDSFKKKYADVFLCQPFDSDKH